MLMAISKHACHVLCSSFGHHKGNQNEVCHRWLAFVLTLKNFNSLQNTKACFVTMLRNLIKYEC